MVALIRKVVAAGAVAGVLSGLPSTVYALARGDDPLEASLAAGTLLRPSENRSLPLLASGAAAHGALSLGWAFVLAVTLPKRHTALAGAAAGLAIAALDLGVVGRRFPRIRALRPGPQIADHLAFGVIAGAVLARGETQR